MDLSRLQITLLETLHSCWHSCVSQGGGDVILQTMMFLLFWQADNVSVSNLAWICCICTKSRFAGVTTSSVGMLCWWSVQVSWPGTASLTWALWCTFLWCTRWIKGTLLVHGSWVYPCYTSVSDTSRAGFPIQDYAGKTYITAFVGTTSLIKNGTFHGNSQTV